MLFKGSPSPWGLCHHLQSEEKDKSCNCGYRGGIFGPDGEHMICEIGSTVIKGEEGLETPRYPRSIELANAKLIAAAPELLEALIEVINWANLGNHIDDERYKQCTAAITKALTI